MNTLVAPMTNQTADSEGEVGKKETQFIGRTNARSRAADILFEADQKGIVRRPAELLALLDQRGSVSPSESALPEYSVRIVEGFSANQREVDDLLERYFKGTTLKRIPSVDRAVLRVAVWELLHNREEVPPVTAIDEAITIAKPVSTDDSPDFINGVLDAIRAGLDDPWSREPVTELESEADEAVETELAAQEDDDLDLLLDEY